MRTPTSRISIGSASGTDPGFDAVVVDPKTVTVTNPSLRCCAPRHFVSTLTDVNGDGLLDLVVSLEVKNNQLKPGKLGTVLVVEGKTFDGSLIRGSASIDLAPNVR